MTTIEEALKNADAGAMSLAAGQSNVTGALKAIADSGKLTDEEFLAIAGRAPCTMAQSLEWAHEEFERAKLNYEGVCRMLGVPAYCTYNED